MNIVFLDAATVGPEISFEPLESCGNFKKYETTEPAQVIERLYDADVAIVNKTRLTAQLIKSCPKLKLICVAATGMNNIDLQYAADAGIVVKNVAGYSTDSVVQLTYGLVLSLLMHLPYYDNFVKSGEYGKSGFFTSYNYCFGELSGKQIGIIGMGNIGKRSAAIGIAFGAKVVYYSTSGKNDSVPYPRLELDELLQTSDIVLIHAPLNENTRNLIDESKFNKMKPTAIIVNTGRGGIINEAALANAVDNGIIAAAATDVYSHEPLGDDNPLKNMKHPERVMLTPHIGWASVESRRRLIAGIVDNIRAFQNSSI